MPEAFMIRDVGRFVGRYLQAIACVSIISMIVSAVFFDAWHIDLTVILMWWAAAYLIQHDSTARFWTITMLGVFLLTLVALVSVAIFVGTENMTIRIGGSKIDQPSLATVLLSTCLMAVIVGIPFALLLTPKARQEFARSIPIQRNEPEELAQPSTAASPGGRVA